VGDLKGNVYRIEMSTGRVKNYNSFKQPILTSVILKENELIVPLAELRGKHSVLIVYNLIRGEETSRVIVDGSIENEILYSKDFLVVTTTNGVVYKLNSDYTFDWKLNLDSQIISQPAANNNFIVTATVDGTIYIISFKGSVIKKIKNKHALMSGFTINDGRIYFGDEGGYIHCYDVDKGEFVFSKQLDAPIRAIPSVDDKLIFIGDVLGNIFALDKLTGEILWKKNYGGLIRNSILILGDKLVVPNYQKKILILDKNTGRILQELEFDGRMKFSPVYVNKNLIIGYDDKKIALLSN
jgi:outer membrane protein assembly factor BamB